MELGKLRKVDLRTAWKNEASDFTQWLAKEENLSLLSDEIGIGIKFIETESNVGNFNSDILAEEENTDRKIIIENQLEYTDHKHLGQLITYASGKNAEIIIWIVKDVRDEHKQAIDWLNEYTDEKIKFFLIKMELWQIGNSPPAPKFQIIVNPNDWAKTMKETTSGSEQSETKLKQLQFWSKFREYAQKNKAKLKLRNPRPQHWYDVTIGEGSRANMSFTMNTSNNTLGCEIYIPDEKRLFEELKKNKEKIEAEIGSKLEWMDLPKKKASRIKMSIDADIDKTDAWNAYFEWLKMYGEKFQEVFQKYIRSIELD